MPDTARLHGLIIDSGIDDRLDVPKSTRAAARYLRDLHARLGDWSLALAAYKGGETVIQSAVLKSGSKTFGLLTSSPREWWAHPPLRAQVLVACRSEVVTADVAGGVG